MEPINSKKKLSFALLVVHKNDEWQQKMGESVDRFWQPLKQTLLPKFPMEISPNPGNGSG